MSRKLLISAGIILWCAFTASAESLENNRNGVQAMEAGRFDEAIACLSQAWQERPDNDIIKNNLAVAYNNAAMDYEKKGDFDTARAYLQKAAALAPDAPAVKKNLAVLLTNESIRRYNAKTGDDIAGMLKDALDYDDSLAPTHVLLGQVYYDQDDYAQAKEQWEKALQLDPARDDVQKKLDKLNREMAGDDHLREQDQLHFKVRYEGDVAWTASRAVLDMLEDAYTEAGHKFGVYPAEPLTVIIYTQEQFRAVSGMPDWFAGEYDGKIRLRRSDVEGDQKRLRQIVYHEYMHAFVHSVAGNNVPTWFNEGIAQCCENMPGQPALNPDEMRFLKNRLAGGVPDMAQIDRFFASRGSEEDVQFAYVYSKAFVAYLITRGWDYNILNVLNELKEGTSIDAAITAYFFRNVEQLRDDWLFELKQNKGAP